MGVKKSMGKRIQQRNPYGKLIQEDLKSENMLTMAGAAKIAELDDEIKKLDEENVEIRKKIALAETELKKKADARKANPVNEKLILEKMLKNFSSVYQEWIGKEPITSDNHPADEEAAKKLATVFSKEQFAAVLTDTKNLLNASNRKLETLYMKKFLVMYDLGVITLKIACADNGTHILGMDILQTIKEKAIEKMTTAANENPEFDYYPNILVAVEFLADLARKKNIMELSSTEVDKNITRMINQRLAKWSNLDLCEEEAYDDNVIQNMTSKKHDEFLEKFFINMSHSWLDQVTLLSAGNPMEQLIRNDALPPTQLEPQVTDDMSDEFEDLAELEM